MSVALIPKVEVAETPLDREIAMNNKLRATNAALRERVELYQKGRALRERNEELRASLHEFEQGGAFAESVAKPLRDRDLKKIQAAFQRVDLDGSGEISASELKAAALEMCEPMTDEQASEALEAMDKDGDGSVSFEEFKNWYLGEDRDGGSMKMRMVRLKMKSAKTARLIKQRSSGLTRTISTGAAGDNGINISLQIGDIPDRKGGISTKFIATDEAAMGTFKASIGAADDTTIVASMAFSLINGSSGDALKANLEEKIKQFEGHMGKVPGLKGVSVTCDETTMRINLCFSHHEDEILSAIVGSPFSAMMVPEASFTLDLSKPLPEFMQGDESFLNAFAAKIAVHGAVDESLTDMAALMGDEVPMALLKTAFKIFGGFSVGLKMNGLGSISEEDLGVIVGEMIRDDELGAMIGFLQQPGDEIGKQARRHLLKMLGAFSQNEKLSAICVMYNLAKGCIANVDSFNVWAPNGHLVVDFTGFDIPAWLPNAPVESAEDEEVGEADEDEDIWG